MERPEEKLLCEILTFWDHLWLDVAIKGVICNRLNSKVALKNHRGQHNHHLQLTLLFAVAILGCSDYCCDSIQCLHPSKDLAFAVFKGKSFRETFKGCVNRC